VVANSPSREHRRADPAVELAVGPSALLGPREDAASMGAENEGGVESRPVEDRQFLRLAGWLCGIKLDR
jgi:hypothetical protein